MKTTKLILLILLTGTTWLMAQDEYSLDWEHEIEVTHGMDEINKEMLYCYSTLVYEAGKGDIKSKISEELAMRTGQKVNKKSMRDGLTITLPKYTEDPVTIKTESEEVGGSGTIKLKVAFIHDTVNVSPDVEKAHEAALGVMQELGVKLNKAVVTIQIEEAKEILSDLESERLKLIKEKEKLEGTLTSSQDKLAKLEGNTAKLESKVTQAKSEATALEAAANSSTATSKDMKAYSKAKSKVTKAESNVIKNKENIMKEQEKINEANLALPTNEQALKDNMTATEAQKEKVAKLEAKLEAIGQSGQES